MFVENQNPENVEIQEADFNSRIFKELLAVKLGVPVNMLVDVMIPQPTERFDAFDHNWVVTYRRTNPFRISAQTAMHVDSPILIEKLFLAFGLQWKITTSRVLYSVSESFNMIRIACEPCGVVAPKKQEVRMNEDLRD